MRLPDHGPLSVHPRLRGMTFAACALLAWLGIAACGAPRGASGRGWAPAVLPAQASLRADPGAVGGAVALLVETERGVLLRLVGSRLEPGDHELVLAPDAGRGLELERLGNLTVAADGRGDLELELEGQTLSGGSRLLGRTLVLVSARRTLLRGTIDKGLESQDASVPPPPPNPARPR